jgi:hypothetical protein
VAGRCLRRSVQSNHRGGAYLWISPHYSSHRCHPLPSSERASKCRVSIYLGLILLTFGVIFKPNVSPTILDQQRQKTAHTKKLKSGETVIVDPEATTTRTMLILRIYQYRRPLYACYHLRRTIGCHFCSHESSICCSQFFWQLFTRKCTGSRLVEDLN